MSAAILVLALVSLERLAELFISHRNVKRLLAEGAHEVGAKHYPLIVTVHVTWLAALFTWAAISHSAVNVFWLAAYLLIQMLRVWVMVSLGKYWTTKIIAVPHAPLITHGPYKFLRHPNYVVVVLEIAVLPLVIGAWPLAAAFSVLNAGALWVRITAENASLDQRSNDQRP